MSRHTQMPETAASSSHRSTVGSAPETGGRECSGPCIEDEANAAKSRAALSSVIWSALLTALKLVAGISTNSLGMLSEALHSMLDFVAAGITFFAVRIAAAPADRRHPFGHGKVENLSALAETALLFITCIWIVREAVERLLFEARPVEPSWWAFGVIVISLLVDISRSAMLRRVAREHKSQALEADALHFSTDILSSAVVLGGLVCVAAARLVEPGSPAHVALTRADAVAALGVAAIVLTVSWRMACRAVAGLMDGGAEAETRRVEEALAAMAPAFQIRQVRVRESGARYFVDLVAAVPPTLRVDDAHEICDILEEVVEQVLPGAETVTHFEPEEAGRRDLYAAAHHLAVLHGLGIHALALTTLNDGLHAFVHIELPPDMELREAHARVSAYERDLARRIGAVHVVSHIEPSERNEAEARPPDTPAGRGVVMGTLREVMAEHPDLGPAYDEEIWMMGNRTELSFRCRADADMTVAEAHRRATRVEDDLRRRLPGLGRVSIHVEPEEEDCPRNERLQGRGLVPPLENALTD